MNRILHIVIAVAAIVAALTPERAMAQQANVPELANDPHYMSLIEKNVELVSRTDSISLLITDLRTEIRNNPEQEASYIKGLRDRILRLEQERFMINNERGTVVNEINRIEQEWAINMLKSPIAFEEEMTTSNDEEESEDAMRTTHRYLYDNYIFREALQEDKLRELYEAQEQERRIVKLIEEYRQHYDTLSNIATAYRGATTEEEALPLYNRFTKLDEEADSLDVEIDKMWDNILTTKNYTYSYLLEMKGAFAQLDKADEEYKKCKQQYNQNVGTYASDALMRYVIGRRAMLDLEYSFAITMELGSAADSLAELRHNPHLPEYRLTPVELEERLFLEYENILFGRTNHYNNSNPIPDLKVYERGTIYRILLGDFRTKQTPTIFKGAQPLYVERTEDGRYIYYAGGYATIEEAERAQNFMKHKGFKSPEICRWENGTMERLESKEESNAKPNATTTESGGDVVLSGKRYMVEIVTDALGSELQEIIKSVAANKRVSRAGNKFVVGSFSVRSEAESLLSAIEAHDSSIEVAISEIEINQ